MNGLPMPERIAAAFAALAMAGRCPARVASAAHGRLKLLVGAGPAVPAVTTGKLAGRIVPAAGDWAVAENLPAGSFLVHDLLPRSGVLERRAVEGRRELVQPLAVNLDSVFIFTACGPGRFANPRLVERMLALAWSSGANPVLVLTKADLDPDAGVVALDLAASAPGVDCLVASAATGEGVDAIAARIGPGETAALLGLSGVGKSSLANRLLGGEHFATGALRESDGRGRHTSASRELVITPAGGYLVDLPGVRELGLSGDADGLAAAFPEIEAFAADCRFRDCTHAGEPDCAVQAALATGELAEERFLAWLDLERERRYAATLVDERARRERDAFWKKISKIQRGLGKGRN
jgi:ribosome biogenesis GTPase